MAAIRLGSIRVTSAASVLASGLAAGGLCAAVLLLIRKHRKQQQEQAAAASALEADEAAAAAPPPRSILKVPKIDRPPSIEGVDPLWDLATPVRIASYHNESSPHRPTVHVKSMYDDDALYIRFCVWDDRDVVGRFRAPNSPVYTDSCVEAFLQVAPNTYVNLEMNCLGAILLGRHVTPREGQEVDPAIFNDQIQRWSSATEEITRDLESKSRWAFALAAVRRVEGPFTWHANVRIPFSLLAELAVPRDDDPTPPPDAYAADVDDDEPLTLPVKKGDTWRAGFFKCADDSHMPHWGAWCDIGDDLNFHQPSRFGIIEFA